MAKWFAHFSRAASRIAGHYVAFVLAVIFIVVWAITGPIFGFSSTWQLVINTSTTIITFLMVFLVQATQNRDAEAMHIKLDELIRAMRRADNEIIRAEDETDEELGDLKNRYERLLRDNGAD